MLLRSSKVGLLDTKVDGDKIYFLHGQDTADAQEKAQLIRTFGDNGWTDDRSMRQIASIPEIEFLKHPELQEMISTNDTKGLRIWLQTIGRQYRTVNGGI